MRTPRASKFVVTALAVLASLAFSATDALAIWSALFDRGTPRNNATYTPETYYVGDFLTHDIYWAFNEDTGTGTHSGFGVKTPGGDWTWYTADYHQQNGANDEWKFTSDNAVKFTASGDWYYAGRFVYWWGTTYAETDWAENDFDLNGVQYFTVTALGNPTGPAATTDSGSQITVSWAKWNSKNVLVVRQTADTGWTLPTGGASYSAGGTIGSGTVVYNGAATSFADTGLSAGTTYYYKVYSVNNDYYSSGAATVSAATYSAPGAPALGTITPGNGQLSVAFTAPTSDGGSSITNYEYSTNDGSTWTARSPAATTSPLVITGLTNGTAYTVRIRAVNAVGSGTASSGTSATPFTTPSAPSITGITPGSGQLSVAFTAGSNGGSSITNYEYSTDDGSTWTARSPAATTSPIVITGLTNGDTYTVRIRAVNAAGSGAQSSSSSGTPVAAATAPAAPAGLAVTPGDEQLSIAFTPGSDGGATITNYEYSFNNSTWTAFDPADDASPVVITGLTNGTAYTVYLRAVNSVGPGTASAGAAGTPRTTPGAPTLGTISPGDAQLSVAFTAPASDGGSAVTDYEYSTDGGSSFKSAGSTASPITITTVSASSASLVNGTSYDVQLRAVNAAGSGAATASSAATPSTTPGTPTSVSVNPGDAELSVVFIAPGDGGSAITDYEYSTDGGSSFKSAGTTTSPMTITTVSVSSSALVNGTSYDVQIRAVNANGAGSATSTATATPRTTPGAPTIGTITPGDGQLSVEFTAPASDGGAAVTDYKWSVDGANYTLRSGTDSPIVITGLSNGTPYTVRILAVNAAGDGAVATAAASATPLSSPAVTTGSASDTSITSVTLGGEVTATGGSSVTERGIYYSTTNGFSDGAGIKVSTAGAFGAGAFTESVTGLSKNTTYYFKAFAVNAAGTSYGAQGSFTTLNAPDGRDPTSNTNPATAYLGDAPNLYIRAWQSFNGVDRSYATVFGRFDNADLTSGASEGAGRNPGTDDADFYAETPRLTQTGTFYWAMRVSYGSGVDYYFDAARPDWSSLAPSLPSAATLTIEVGALNDPSGVSATAASSTSVDLSWTRGTSGNEKDTIIVRREGSAVETDPSQGTAYNAGNALGTGTVVYRGSGTTFTDTGLSPGATYHYKLYAENWSYYSPGVTAEASVAATPTISVSGTPGAMSTNYGTPSTAGNFSVSGSFLTADLTVAAPAGFEVSTASDSGFADTIALSPSSGTVASTTIYVRLKANASPGSNSGDVTVSSTGAASQTVAVSGTVSVATMSMTINSPAGSMNADYTTSKLFADELAGTTNNVTITFSPGVTADEVEVWTNLNNRERADDDANGDGIPDGIIPPTPPTDKPEGYTSGAYPADGYFQAHPMSGSGGVYTLTINASKTGAYRLTARYRMNGGTWVWYNHNGKRDHAITVTPILARKMQVYEINTLNINATGSTFETRSTFEDLTDTNSGRVNLDYLRNLGVNTLWFQPVHPNGVEGREPSGGWDTATSPYDPGSPYAVKNFFEVMEIMTDNYNGSSSSAANRAASMSAFTNFVAQADAKGVHVMLDAPFNHTAYDVELSAQGLSLLSEAGVDTSGWSATDKIKDREARFFSRNDGSNAYA
ncbi:MAG: fibronectin type III domain-containing protein, partial [Chthoniobacterales bacterium]